MLSTYIFDHGFKPSVEPSLDRKLNALLFENHDGGLNENLLYEILRSDLFFVFFVPPFHFFVLFFTPTANGLRWKAVNRFSQGNPEVVNANLVSIERIITHKTEHSVAMSYDMALPNQYMSVNCVQGPPALQDTAPADLPTIIKKRKVRLDPAPFPPKQDIWWAIIQDIHSAPNQYPI